MRQVSGHVSFWLIAAVLGCVAATGCTTVHHLREPSNVPVFVKSYSGRTLNAQAKDVSCKLNLVNCPDCASVTVATFTGTTKIGPTFDVKNILADEFAAVARANFRTELTAEQAQIEIVVEPQRLRLVRDGDAVSFAITLLLRVREPQSDKRMIFMKRYDRVANGVVYDEETLYPCVYEAIQRIAAEFVKDLDGDVSVVTALDALTNPQQERNAK